MNKGLIASFITRKANKKKQEVDNQEIRDLISQIQEARLEMNAAREMFEYVCEPKLVEAVIYREEAAIKRYEYLISLAKRREIKKYIE